MPEPHVSKLSTYPPSNRRTWARSALLLAILVLSLTVASTAAANGCTLPGSGTAQNPYVIATTEALLCLRDSVAYWGTIASPVAIALQSDLDLRASAAWTAGIGTPANPFIGSFDGGNHTITGVTVSSTSDQIGLFGIVQASTITNLTLSSIDVRGNAEVGGVAGVIADGSTIRNVRVEGTITGTSKRIGGIAGTVTNGSTMVESTMRGTVEASSCGEYEVALGGLIGRVDQSIIQASASYADVTSSKTGTYCMDVGGAMGHAFDSELTDVHATGAVVGNERVGGLIGQAITSSITRSSATGSVEGIRYVAGIAGLLSNAEAVDTHATGTVEGDSIIGGLVGYGRNAVVLRSHATGPVVGAEFQVGGLIGLLQDGEVQNAFATGDVSGTDLVGGLIGEMSHDGNQDSGPLVSSSHATSGVRGAKYVGGLVGRMSTATVLDAYATGDVSGEQHVGGLVGTMDISEDAIEFVYDEEDEPTRMLPIMIDAYATGSVTATRNNVGGAVGETQGAILTRVRASGTVTSRGDPTAGDSDGEDDGLNVGGLVGRATGEDGRSSEIPTLITDSSSTSAVSASEGWAVGGLIGRSMPAVIHHASATGSVHGKRAVGGLIGEIDDDPARPTRISSSWASGRVTGTTCIGGFAGIVRNTVRDAYATGAVGSQGSGTAVGGFAGCADDASITRVMATGRVQGASALGGLLGYSGIVGTSSTSPAPTDSFWATDGTGQATTSTWNVNDGVSTTTEGASPTEDLQRTEPFLSAGWDIVAADDAEEAVWLVCPEVSVPFLAWEGRNPPCGEPAPSTNATLRALTTNVAALQPRLQASVRTYTIVLPTTQGAYTLTALATHPSATVRIDGNGGGKGRSVLTIPVAEGDSVTSMVTVTAEDGVTTETYTVIATRQAASSDAPMGFWVAPDDGRIVLGFEPPSADVLNVEVQLGDGPWTAFQPAVTLAPVVLDGMPNGSSVTVRIRFVTPDGVSTASVPLAVTPNPSSQPTLATSFGTVAPDDVRLDARTLTFDVAITVTNASEQTLNHAWLAPSLRGGDIVDVRPSGTQGTIHRVGDAWLWTELNLAPGESAVATVTVRDEVQ